MAGNVAKIIGTVYDEIILEVPEKMAREVVALLNETMIQVRKAYLARVSVYYWGDMGREVDKPVSFS